jgi:hypothetical protein
MTTLLLVALTAVGIPIDGDVTCPRPSEVEQRLAPMLAALSPQSAAERLHLSSSGGVLRVELVEGGARLVRELPLRQDCTHLAELVAVVVAAWHVQLQSELGVGAPAMPTPPVLAAPSVHQVEAALAASIADEAAAGGLVGWRWWPTGAWAVRAAAELRAPRAGSLGEGRFRAWRASALVGAAYGWGSALGGPRLDVAADLVASWLHARGEGVPEPTSASGFEPGAAAAVRGAWAAGRMAAFVSVGCLGWLNRQLLVAERPGSLGGAAVELPRVELQLVAGVALRFSP